MVKKDSVKNNVPIKKMSYSMSKGYIIIKLYDGHYNKIFEGKANLNDKQKVRELKSDLKMKGCDLFDESSWF